MRIIKNLAQHKLVVLMIVVLLCAGCVRPGLAQLHLRYVDTGIQQQGVRLPPSSLPGAPMTWWP